MLTVCGINKRLDRARECCENDATRIFVAGLLKGAAVANVVDGYPRRIWRDATSRRAAAPSIPSDTVRNRDECSKVAEDALRSVGLMR